MIPKFANPHLVSQDVEITTRSEIARRAEFTSVVCDENSHSLKRNLDNMLRDTWADALVETCGPSRARTRLKTAEARNNEGDQVAFRLVSSMKHPQYISLDPRPLPSFVSRGPDCEDDKGQADTRRIRALSVALEPKNLPETVVSRWQANHKPVTVESKITLANTPKFARPLPPMLVTEEVRVRKHVRRVRTGNPQAGEGLAASPHEPRPSCVILPVVSVPDNRKVGKKRRKPVRERPPPAYWRPSLELQGKCMGYALGYPSNWAPDRLYVRDGMKSGVKCTSPCHAVHDASKSE